MKAGLTNFLPGTAIERGSVIASTPPTSPARIVLLQPSPLQDVTTAEEQGTDLPSPYLRDPAGHRPTHPAPRSSTPGVVQPNPQHTRHSPVNTVEEAEADDPNPQHTIRRNQEQVEGNETDEDVFFEQINSGFLETSSQSFDSTLPQAASWRCPRIIVIILKLLESPTSGSPPSGAMKEGETEYRQILTPLLEQIRETWGKSESPASISLLLSSCGGGHSDDSVERRE